MEKTNTITSDRITLDRYSDAYRLAEFMHSNYEYFAARNNWRTQRSTRVEFENLPPANQRTMLDLADHLIKCFEIDFDVIAVPPKRWWWFWRSGWIL